MGTGNCLSKLVFMSLEGGGGLPKLVFMGLGWSVCQNPSLLFEGLFAEATLSNSFE